LCGEKQFVTKVKEKKLRDIVSLGHFATQPNRLVLGEAIWGKKGEEL